MDYVIVIICTIIAIFFVYCLGHVHGTQIERTKQDEKEIDTLKRAYNARNNADIDSLRKKFKRDSV